MKLISIDINCDIKEITLKDFTQTKHIIGGWTKIIKPLRLPYPYVMMIDEEGEVKQKDINPIGCFLHQAEREKTNVVGKVLIGKLKHHMVTGLEREDTKHLNNYLKNIRTSYFNNKCEMNKSKRQVLIK